MDARDVDGAPEPADAVPSTMTSAERWRARSLWGAVLAGPLYVTVAAGQVIWREGFDLRRHAISLLSNGQLGWIQIANFVVTGLLVVAGAIGLRHAIGGAGRGAVWGPRLLAFYGLGLIASGVFVADPADGFPPGTPTGTPADVSWHGVLHFVAGGTAFVALIAACFVLTRRSAAAGERGWAVLGAATGGCFALAFVLVASAPGLRWANELFSGAVVLSWVWLSAVAWRARADEGEGLVRTVRASYVRPRLRRLLRVAGQRSDPSSTV